MSVAMRNWIGDHVRENPGIMLETLIMEAHEYADMIVTEKLIESMINCKELYLASSRRLFIR